MIAWGIFKFLCDEYWNRRPHVIGCSARWVLGSIVYEKQLRLTPSTSKQFTTDQINRVLHREIHQFWYLMHEYFEMYLIPFKLMISWYYLFQLLGKSCITGVVLVGIAMGIQRLLDRYQEGNRKEREKIQDKRSQYTSEMINNIKTVKFYGW